MASGNLSPSGEDMDVMKLAQSLMIKEIILAASPGLITYGDRRHCADLLAAVQSSQDLQREVREAYERKVQHCSDIQNERVKCACFQESSEDVEEAVGLFALETYLASPSEEVKSSHLAKFIDRTSNRETAQVVCVVCACKVFSVETEEVDLDALPGQDLLVLFIRHCAQHLVCNMLLYHHTVSFLHGKPSGRVCTKCLQDLCTHKLPALALSNGLWVGDVPPQLAILTLPERVLIGLNFPVAYIVKLYPQKKGARNWDTLALNSGLRGNVSTYRLNTSDISSMIEGRLLPRRPALLVATIGISIIGPKNLPVQSLPSFLTVHHGRVKDALQFLKEENELY
jgi:hypothetical protein